MYVKESILDLVISKLTFPENYFFCNLERFDKEQGELQKEDSSETREDHLSVQRNCHPFIPGVRSLFLGCVSFIDERVSSGGMV